MSDEPKVLIEGLHFGGVYYGDVISLKEYDKLKAEVNKEVLKCLDEVEFEQGNLYKNGVSHVNDKHAYEWVLAFIRKQYEDK